MLWCLYYLQLATCTRGPFSLNRATAAGLITGKQEGNLRKRKRYLYVTCSHKAVHSVDDNQVHYIVNNTGNLFKNFWCKPLAVLRAADEFNTRIVYRDLDFIPHKFLSPDRLSRDLVHTEVEYGSTRSNAYVIVFGSRSQIQGYHSFMLDNIFKFQGNNYDQDALNAWNQSKLAHPNGRLGQHFNSKIANRDQLFKTEKYPTSPYIRVVLQLSFAVLLLCAYRVFMDPIHRKDVKRIGFNGFSPLHSTSSLLRLPLLLGICFLLLQVASTVCASTYYGTMQLPSKCSGYWEALGLVGDPSVRTWQCGRIYQVGDPEGVVHISWATFYSLNVFLKREVFLRLLYPGVLRQFGLLSITILVMWEMSNISIPKHLWKARGCIGRFYRHCWRLAIRPTSKTVFSTNAPCSFYDLVKCTATFNFKQLMSVSNELRLGGRSIGICGDLRVFLSILSQKNVTQRARLRGLSFPSARNVLSVAPPRPAHSSLKSCSSGGNCSTCAEQRDNSLY